MKIKFRIISIMFFSFLFLIVGFFSTTKFVEAVDDKSQKLKSETRISAKANIPIFQSLEIIKKPNVNYSFLMDNYNGSKEIIVEEALTIEVLSNSRWHLRLNNKNLNLKAMIKKTSQNDNDWQNLNLTTAKFRGENGVHRITFDLKFILDQNFRAAVNNLELDLKHSLSPELY